MSSSFLRKNVIWAPYFKVFYTYEKPNIVCVIYLTAKNVRYDQIKNLSRKQVGNCCNCQGQYAPGRRQSRQYTYKTIKMKMLEKNLHCRINYRVFSSYNYLERWWWGVLFFEKGKFIKLCSPFYVIKVFCFLNFIVRLLATYLFFNRIVVFYFSCFRKVSRIFLSYVVGYLHDFGLEFFFNSCFNYIKVDRIA